MKILLVTADRTGPDGSAVNLGDALLTDALAARLVRGGHDVLVSDFGDAPRPGDEVWRVRLGGPRDLLSAARSVDLVLVGGGTLFADDQPDRPFAGLPRLLLATRVAALLARRRFAVFGAGVDPIRRRRASLALATALKGGPRWLRDADSARRASGWGAPARTCGDVSLFAADELATLGREPDERSGVVLALNRREAAQLTVAHVRALGAGGRPVRFLSMDQGDDADDSALADDVRQSLEVLSTGRSWHDAGAVLGASEHVVASRMHAMYVSMMTGTPVTAVGSTAKVVTFCRDHGLPLAADLDEAVGLAPRDVRARVVGARSRLEAACLDLENWMHA